MCVAQGNPQTLLIDEEEAEIKAELKQELATWLQEALQRLPKNQQACITLRFWLDNGEPRPKNKNGIRTTAEIAEIVGVHQSTAFRNIQRGLKKLKKDFNSEMDSSSMTNTTPIIQ